jgi:drug/metabolite transporter (DMT)-like permease
VTRSLRLGGEPTLLVLLWSSGAVAIGIGLDGMSPQLFLTVRAIGAAACAWAIVLAARSALPTGRDLATVVGAGLLLQVTYQGAYFLAIAHHISAGMISLIMSAQPLLTVVAAGALSRRTAAGAALGVVGVGVAVIADTSSTGASVVAFAFAAVALLAITAGTLVQAKVTSTTGWSCVAVQSTVSATVFGSVVAAVGPGEVHLTASSVVAAAWVTIVVSVIATALLYRITRERGAVVVSGLFLVVPSCAAGLDYLLTGATVPPLAIAGGAVAVIGLVMLQQPVRRSRPSIRRGRGRRLVSPS